MVEAPTRVAWRSAVLFVLCAFVLSWTVWIGLRAAGVPFTVRAAIGMFGPAASALLVRLVLGEGFRDLGLRLSRPGRPASDIDWAAYLFGYIGVPLVLTAGLVLALLVGGQHLAPLRNAQALLGALARQAPAGRALPPPAVLFAADTLSALTFAPVINALFAFGEELGWRSHLLIRLAPGGVVRAAIAGGVVWGLWHAPVIYLDGYEYGLAHRLMGPFFFVLYTVPLSVVLSWLRLRSGSVWPSSLAHGAINAQAGVVLLALSAGNRLIGPPVGLLGIVPVAAVATWLVATGRLRNAS